MCIQPVPPNQFFEDYRHFINTKDIDGKLITEESLRGWAEDPNRKFTCIFCGSKPIGNDFMYCPRCKEYKGIIPDVFPMP